MLLHLLRVNIAVLLVLMFTALPAHAKKITIEWAPEKQAISYELKVYDSSGKEFVHRRVDQSQYQGNLKPGVYFWQIRLIDRLKRPGRWADPEPLVVMAKPPTLQSPADDSEIIFYSPNASVLFKWDAVPGATAYLVKLTKDGAALLEKEVTANSLEVPLPESGDYTWTVHSVLTPGTGAPAALMSRRWQSESAEPVPFSIEYKTLALAQIIEPIGIITVPARNSLRFAWSPVENAESYEVRLQSPEKIYRTKKTAIDVSLRDLGKIEEGKSFTWTVKAIPLRAPASVALDQSTTGSSQADFRFSTEMRELLRRGSLEIHTFLAPTSYRFVAPDSGHSGDTSAITSGMKISGVRYPKGKLGFGGSFEHLSINMADESYSLNSFEVGAHYRKALSGKGTGWLLNAHVGLGLKEYFELFPTVFIDTVAQSVTVTGTSDVKVSTLGPASGVDLKRFLTDRWTLQFSFAHYLPMMKMGSSEVDSLQSPGLLDNYALGVRIGWESRYWGYNLGLVNDRRAVKFNRKLTNGTASSNTDETSSSAWTLFTGVSYSFY